MVDVYIGQNGMGYTVHMGKLFLIPRPWMIGAFWGDCRTIINNCRQHLRQFGRNVKLPMETNHNFCYRWIWNTVSLQKKHSFEPCFFRWSWWCYYPISMLLGNVTWHIPELGFLQWLNPGIAKCKHLQEFEVFILCPTSKNKDQLVSCCCKLM